MTKVKMKLVNIISDHDNLNEVLSRFIELRNFHPEPAIKIAKSVHGLSTLYDTNPYIKLLDDLKNLAKSMGIDLINVPVDSKHCDVLKISTYVEDSKAKYDELCSHLKEIEQLVVEDEDALIQVKNIESLDVSLDDLFSCETIVSRVGSLPLDSQDRLKYYSNRPFIWNSFSVDKSYSRGIYITTKAFEREVDNIFASLYFERSHIPDFVHGTPERAKENLQEEIESMKKSIQKLNDRKIELLEKVKDSFSFMSSELEYAIRVYEARQYVVDFGQRISITGFIPEEELENLAFTFKNLSKVEIEIRPPHNDMRLSPPKGFRKSWFKIGSKKSEDFKFSY
ncbi:MAG: hypothetical protein WBI17_02585 [Clostridiaceae bacterium]